MKKIEQTERVVEKFLIIPRRGPNGWRWLCRAKVRYVLWGHFQYTGGFGEHGAVNTTWKEEGLVE